MTSLPSIVATLFLVGASAAAGVFVIQNDGWVVVRLPHLALDLHKPIYFLEYDIVLAWVLVGAFCSGAGLVFSLLYLPSRLRSAYRGARQRKMILELEEEVDALRNLPVTHPAPFEDLPAGGESERLARPGESGEDFLWIGEDRSARRLP